MIATSENEKPVIEPSCPPHDFVATPKAPVPPELYTYENTNEMRSESEFRTWTCTKCGAQEHRMKIR